MFDSLDSLTRSSAHSVTLGFSGHEQPSPGGGLVDGTNQKREAPNTDTQLRRYPRSHGLWKVCGIQLEQDRACERKNLIEMPTLFK
jgi:hypothetical protein